MSLKNTITKNSFNTDKVLLLKKQLQQIVLTQTKYWYLKSDYKDITKVITLDSRENVAIQIYDNSKSFRV